MLTGGRKRERWLRTAATSAASAASCASTAARSAGAVPKGNGLPAPVASAIQLRMLPLCAAPALATADAM